MLCADCSGHELVEVDADHKLRVADFLFQGSLRAGECPRCRLRHVDGTELERFELAVARALAMSSVLSAEALRFMREAIGATHRQVAAEVQVPVPLVHRWESGRSPVPAEAMGRIARMVLRRTDRPDVPRIQMRELARTEAPRAPRIKAASGD